MPCWWHGSPLLAVKATHPTMITDHFSVFGTSASDEILPSVLSSVMFTYSHYRSTSNIAIVLCNYMC